MSGERTLSNSPERDLWQNVLLMVVQDALFGGLRRAQGKAKSKELDAAQRAYDCQKARDYLTKPSTDLSIVCALAGLNMRAVIEHMTRQIAAAPSPEQLAASDDPRVSRKKRIRTAELKPYVPKDGKRHTYNGQSLTLKEWAVYTGVHHSTLYTRIAAGWTLERALTERSDQRKRAPKDEPEDLPNAKPKGDPRPRKPNPARTLTHAGETMTLKQWAARLGLSKPTIDKRLRAGWPIEHVLSAENMRGKSFGIRKQGTGS